MGFQNWTAGLCLFISIFFYIFINLFGNFTFFCKCRTCTFCLSRRTFGFTLPLHLDLFQWLFKKKRKRRGGKKGPFAWWAVSTSCFTPPRHHPLWLMPSFSPPHPPFLHQAADSWPSVSSHLCLLFIDTNKIECQIKNCHHFSSCLQWVGWAMGTMCCQVTGKIAHYLLDGGG